MSSDSLRRDRLVSKHRPPVKDKPSLPKKTEKPKIIDEVVPSSSSPQKNAPPGETSVEQALLVLQQASDKAKKVLEEPEPVSPPKEQSPTPSQASTAVTKPFRGCSSVCLDDYDLDTYVYMSTRDMDLPTLVSLYGTYQWVMGDQSAMAKYPKSFLDEVASLPPPFSFTGDRVLRKSEGARFKVFGHTFPAKGHYTLLEIDYNLLTNTVLGRSQYSINFVTLQPPPGFYVCCTGQFPQPITWAPYPFDDLLSDLFGKLEIENYEQLSIPHTLIFAFTDDDGSHLLHSNPLKC